MKLLYLMLAILPINQKVLKSANTQFETVIKIRNTNFTGIWKINEQLSQLGTVPKTANSRYIEITQSNDSISFTRYGRTKITQSMPLNGTICSLRIEEYKKNKKSFLSWNKQGNELIETATFKYDVPQTDAYQTKYIETWSLSSDGKVLTVYRNMEINDTKLNWVTKCVYDKIDKI